MLRQSKIARAVTTLALVFVAAGTVAAAGLVAGARWGLTKASGPVEEGGWTRRSRAAFVPSGFYPAELDTVLDRSFSWTQHAAELTFPALNRGQAHLVTLTLRGGRPSAADAPTLRILVDGQLRTTTAVPGPASDVAFEIPRAPVTSAVVRLEVSPTYEPGGSDPRALGVIVDRVSISPVSSPFQPTTGAMLLVALAVGLVAMGIRVCGLVGWWGAAATLAMAAGCVWLSLLDAAFVGEFPGRLVQIGAGAAAAGGLVGLVRRRWPAIGGMPDWSAAAGLLLAATAVKVALVWHPLAVVGDGLFQVHRAQAVHAGQYFFTSVTPKPFFEFPYPVALYVFAQPLWDWFRSELDLLRLLRLVNLTADAVAGLALFGVARRLTGLTPPAMLCAALWPFARAPFEALSNANLTNLFGQSTFTVALAVLAWGTAVSPASIGALGIAAVFLVVAFLSHFGTVTVGCAVLGFVATALLVAGGRDGRQAGVWVLGVILAAAIASWAIYYSHFTEVYAKTWSTIGMTPADDSSKIVAAPLTKLARWWSGTGDDYGRPGLLVLLASCAGAIWLGARYPWRTISLTMLAWLAAWIALTTLGILTPLTLRANLAVAPALIFCCSVLLGALASRSRLGTAAAVLAAAALAWDGWQVGLACLRLASE